MSGVQPPDRVGMIATISTLATQVNILEYE